MVAEKSADIKDKIQRHQTFWRRVEGDRPVIGFTVGEYFPALRFEAGRALLEDSKEITPSAVEPRDFLPDYERQYQDSLETGQDAFWVAAPYPGIPWMEAILGCRIFSSSESFWTEPTLDDWNELERVASFRGNPWFVKYVEFLQVLIEQAKGRYPVGQPALRGPSDIISALRGQTQLILDLYDVPTKVGELCDLVTKAFLALISTQTKLVPDFYDGRAVGFFDLWSPGKCLWYQEDSSSLLSPLLYRKFLLGADAILSDSYSYTGVHLHPASLFLLDEFLQLKGLKVIEINKDIQGQSIEEMIPVFTKVLERKRLLIWGALNREEVRIVLDRLPARGLFLHLVVASVEEARNLMAVISGNRMDEPSWL